MTSPRLGFLRGRTVVPNDFDRFAEDEIAALFGIGDGDVTAPTTNDLLRELVITLITDPPAINGKDDVAICPLCWQFGTKPCEMPPHADDCPYILAKRLAERLRLEVAW